MATEKRLIDANAVLKKMQNWNTKERLINCVEDAPTVDAVSRGVHDQVRWERDVAIQQLEEHGIPFGGIAADVVKVVRCKDCKHYNDYYIRCDHPKGLPRINENAFCSCGERREGE